MKKILLAILTLLAGLGIYGCSDEETSSSLTKVDLDNPDTIVGSYRIYSFALQDNNTVLIGGVTGATSCTASDVTALPLYDNATSHDCSLAGELGEIVSIQKHNTSDGTTYSVVIQLQLYNNDILYNNNRLQNSAYRHLLFPIEESYFTDGWGTDAVSKATERGLSSYIIERPYGDKTNTNMYIQRMAIETITDTDNSTGDTVETDLLVMSLKTEDNKNYVYKLIKTSDAHGNYVSLVNQDIPQAGLSAISSIFNTLIVGVDDVYAELGADAYQVFYTGFTTLLNE